MRVKDCMTKQVISVGAGEPVSVAARLMARYNLGRTTGAAGRTDSSRECSQTGISCSGVLLRSEAPRLCACGRS